MSRKAPIKPKDNFVRPEPPPIPAPPPTRYIKDHKESRYVVREILLQNASILLGEKFITEKDELSGEKKMNTAEELRNLTEKAKMELKEKHFNEIYQALECAAKLGKYDCQITTPYLEEITEYLNLLGFNLSASHQIYTSAYGKTSVVTVSWL